MNKLLTSLSRITWKQTIYPALLLCIGTAITVVFTLVTRSLTRDLNTAFAVEENPQIVTFNHANFAIVAQKLNIPDTSQPTPSAPAATTTTATSSAKKTKATPSSQTATSTRKNI